MFIYLNWILKTKYIQHNNLLDIYKYLTNTKKKIGSQITGSQIK